MIRVFAQYSRPRLTEQRRSRVSQDAQGDPPSWHRSWLPNLGSDLRRRQLQAALRQVPPDAQAAVSANMFQFYAQDSDRFTGDRDLDLVRELNPELQSFPSWLAKHKDEVKAATN